jgi:secondary thiamine-phosphate synthase enzyme
MKRLSVNTEKRSELIEITGEVRQIVEREGKKSGIIFLYVPHTTAGLTINENADPAVKHDITRKMSGLVPAGGGYTHSEGNSDAHVKTSMFGSELFFFIENGCLQLGAWQGIYFCEFDGPRKRELYYKII